MTRIAARAHAGMIGATADATGNLAGRIMAIVRSPFRDAGLRPAPAARPGSTWSDGLNAGGKYKLAALLRRRTGQCQIEDRCHHVH
jgi:hypothetical protein